MATGLAMAYTLPKDHLSCSFLTNSVSNFTTATVWLFWCVFGACALGLVLVLSVWGLTDCVRHMYLYV